MKDLHNGEYINKNQKKYILNITLNRHRWALVDILKANERTYLKELGKNNFDCLPKTQDFAKPKKKSKKMIGEI